MLTSTNKVPPRRANVRGRGTEGRHSFGATGTLSVRAARASLAQAVFLRCPTTGRSSMSTTYRVTPRFFGEYLDRNVKLVAEGDEQMCTGCGDHPGYGYLDGMGDQSPHCLGCLGYAHGHDQAEERWVRSIVGAAVAAALGTGASEELVHLAVRDALSENVRVDGDWIA